MPTVFSCVASRNREAAGPRGEASQSPVGAQPSRGESISFLSPAQAAGAPTFCDATESRQRSQPKGRLPPWLSPAGATELSQAFLRADASGTLQRKAQPSCAERHRKGRAMLRIATGSSQSSAEISLRRPPPPPLRTGLLLENRDRRSRAPPPPPPRRAQLRCCSAGYGAFSEKEPRPTVSGRAPGKFFRFNSSLKRYISLLRRGARNLERTALKPRGLPLRRAGGAARHPVLACRVRKTVSVRAPWRFILFRQVRNS